MPQGVGVGIIGAKLPIMLLAGGYAAAGWVLAFVHELTLWDAWSRVASAFFVLFSRDPHLSAIGFVWNPLPTVALLPLMPFQVVFPGLVTAGFAGNIVSAIFMATAVYQLYGIYVDAGIGWRMRAVFTGTFALHPMILFFGANGMSEAPFLAFLLMTCRYFLRWLASGHTQALVGVAVGLAMAYLTRQEAIAPAAGVLLLVFLFSYGMAGGHRNNRVTSASADVLIVGLPFAATFVGWAFVSWIIVGSPFEQFTSAYSISAQASLIADDIRLSIGTGLEAQLRQVARQALGMAPFVAGLVLVATAFGALRRDPRILAPLTIFGSVLVFTALAFATGRTFGWLRYYIAVVPLLWVVAGLLYGDFARSWRALGKGARPVRALAGSLVLLAVVASLPVSLVTMLDRQLNRGDDGIQFRAFAGGAVEQGGSADARESGAAVAAHIDSLELDEGSVLVDVASGLAVVTQSNFPRQFVITTDRDFQAALADPDAFDVDYLLVPAAQGQYDAIAATYPDVYETGAGVGRLEWAYEAGEGSYEWRLFVVQP